METLDFVFFKSRKDRKGEPFSIDFDGFCDRIKKHFPHTATAETASRYAEMSKEQRSEAKDRGGIVFAQLENNRRGNKYTLSKTAAVIDYDHQEAGEFARITERVKDMGVLAWIYTTHSHTEADECFRVVFPFAHPIDPEQGERANKALADMMGGVYDTTTTEQARLFYTPTHPKDAPFENLTFAGYPIDPSDYATPAEHAEGKRGEAKKPEDPATKAGVIGAFCRAYTVPEAIEEFLHDKYTQGSRSNRYTWAEGSGADGFVVMDGGKFGYSHHGTDPLNANGESHIYNAYDLVRVHKFNGDAMKMRDFANSLPSVIDELNRAAAKDFANFDGADDTAAEWMAKLERGKKGEIKPTYPNISLIFRNDPDLMGWHYDTFTNQVEKENVGQITDRAHAAITVNTFGLKYGMEAGRQKIKDVLDCVMYDRTKDSLKEYFDGLPEWDGTPRVENLLIKYFRCTDNEYHRHIIKMHLTAAVARAYNTEGTAEDFRLTKYDHVLVFAGAQGVGKSTFIRLLCPFENWVNDSISTIHGREGVEALIGNFLIELSELAALKKADTESIKSYITRISDKTRLAYRINAETYRRRCVFFGTTNETEFLRGLDGNRRFLVCEVKATTAPDFSDLIRERAQIWAEAKHYYLGGFPLYLPPHLSREAEQQQKRHNQDENELQAMAEKVREYITQKIPADWAAWDNLRRRSFYTSRDPLTDESVERDYICTSEILWEMFGIWIKDHRFSSASKDLKRIMQRHFPEWEKTNKIKINGVDKNGYKKKL